MKLLLVPIAFFSLILVRLAPAAIPPQSPVVWFEIHVTDLDRSFPFYSQLFDWKCVPGRPPFKSCNVVLNGQEIGEVIENKSERQGSAVLIYFPVDNVVPFYRKALSLGGTSVYPPMNIPDGHPGSIAVIKDLDGISIGLFSQKPLPIERN